MTCGHVWRGRLARAFHADAVVLGEVVLHCPAGLVGDAVRAQQAVGAAAVACMAGHRRDAGVLVHIAHVCIAVASQAFAVACGDMARHLLAGFVGDAVRAQQAVGAAACALACRLADAGVFLHIAHGRISAAGLAVASFVYELIADGKAAAFINAGAPVCADVACLWPSRQAVSAMQDRRVCGRVWNFAFVTA